MKIAIGADHGGVCLKPAIIEVIEKLGYTYHDFGCFDTQSVDYPVFAKLVGKAVQNGECDRGILLCGTGIGMSIVANKLKGIRCGHVTDPDSARLTRQHNNANVIALGGRITDAEQAKAIVEAYLTAEFEGGRHEKRVAMINELDEVHQ